MDKINPSVTVLMPTYNHEKFIFKAIDSVLMQETNFPVFLVISDDASTDDTFNIILSFLDRNNVKIVLHRNEKNIGALLNGAKLREEAINLGCKYVAILEGDDYWTDPHKLQRQVDFLEKNSSYSFCIHAADTVDENNLLIPQKSFRKNTVNRIIDINKAISSGGGSYATSSLVFKNLIKSYPEFMHKAQSGDSALLLLLALNGNGMFLDFKASCYRIHGGGINSSVQKNVADRVAWQIRDVEMLNAFNLYTSGKYATSVQRAKYKHIVKMVKLQELTVIDSWKFISNWFHELPFYLCLMLIARTLIGRYH